MRINIKKIVSLVFSLTLVFFAFSACTYEPDMESGATPMTDQEKVSQALTAAKKADEKENKEKENELSAIERQKAELEKELLEQRDIADMLNSMLEAE